LSFFLNTYHDKDKEKDEKISAVHDGVALKIQKIFIEWLETDRTAKKLHLNIIKKLLKKIFVYYTYYICYTA
jgi:hypothetical protein